MTGPRLLAVAASFALLSPAAAAGSDWVGDARAAVRLLTAVASLGAPSIEAGVEFRFAPGWHGYWRTPGDAGIPAGLRLVRYAGVEGRHGGMARAHPASSSRACRTPSTMAASCSP